MRFLSVSLTLLFSVSFFSYCQSQSFTSSNLPIVLINTNGRTIVDDPKIGADFGIIDNGPGQVNNVTDPYTFDGYIGIEIRGSSSQMFPKKQYGFELMTETGVKYDTSLLGLPAENDWILFAPYNDKALMRDVLAYKLAKETGRYAPRTRYCELILNGSYHGIYVLIEKIKRNKNRVDVAKLTPEDNSGEDVTGGYIIKIDKQTGDSDPGWNSIYPPPYGRSGAVVNFQFEYPDPEDMSGQQKEYIMSFMEEFETALKSRDFADPVDGYAKYVDMGSFVDFYLINEISKNVDGFRLSTYMHKQKSSDGGKLVMGPVWDFNLGFGNANYCTGGAPTGSVLDFNQICPGDFWLIPFWWKRFFQDLTYAKMLDERYAELRAGAFSTDNILAYIDSVALSLDGAQQRNFQRWPVLNVEIWPNYFVGESFEEEVEWLKNWMVDRMNWMDAEMANVVTSVDAGPEVMVGKPFPNPSANTFIMNYTVPAPGSFSIEIYDMLGRVVDNQITTADSSGNGSLVIGDRLTNGHYFYKIGFNGKPVTFGKVAKK